MIKKKIIGTEINKQIINETDEQIKTKKIEPTQSFSIPLRKKIEPELYSEIEKKIVEYFNAQPIYD